MKYGLATWIAISGEAYYGVDIGGPNATTVSKQWLRDNIQIGPYGSIAYPDYKYIMEGDSPTFLYLIQNGLGDPENAGYGSWGGRYSKVNYLYNHYSDAADRVMGVNNRTFKSNYATIWRWREAYQADFAARMQWSLPANVSKANHHPVVSVNGSVDGDELSYNWFQYQEPGSNDWNVAGQVPALKLDTSSDGQQVQFDVPAEEEICNGKGENPSGCLLLHLILELKDNAAPYPLTSYRRVLIQTTNGTLSA
ncbi:uncharacterized protein BDV17DRAFT_295053 [Aspergillus undulatus]|uniref:uncharacterized protein n=1 Tax=Aspergillus undulatus TaxID=1810928 RepID=UPI003CCDB953